MGDSGGFRGLRIGGLWDAALGIQGIGFGFGSKIDSGLAASGVGVAFNPKLLDPKP